MLLGMHIISAHQLDWIYAAFRCGPCHAIAPTFEALAKQYKNVNFLKCDVDAARDVASLYSVSAMCVPSVDNLVWERNGDA